MADFKLTDLQCKHCAVMVDGISTQDWVVEMASGRFVAAICPDCYSKHGTTNEEAQILGAMRPVYTFEAPLAGNFRPVKTYKEISRLRDCGDLGATWWELESSMFELLSEGYKVLKLNVDSGEYDEVWVQYVWDGNRISSINVSGDRPKRKFELNVYQRARLEAMGLTEYGSTNKDWTISLTSEESSFENVMRMTSHILQFGLLLQSHKIHGLGPIVDTKEK